MTRLRRIAPRGPRLLVVSLMGAYLLAFAPLARALGPAASIFSLLPSVAAGALLGMRAGALVGLLAILADIILFRLLGYDLIRVFAHPAAVLGHLGMVSVSIIAGRLRDLHVELQVALRARDEMIQHVSHELRTPLTLIRGYIELLQTGALGPLTAQQRRAIEVMDRQSDHLHYMVERLLLLQSLETLVLAKEPLEVKPFLEELVYAWKARAQEANVCLHLEIPSALPAVMADKNLLYQVLYNLLDNAIKFSPQGGDVRLRAWVEGGELRIAVVDQGIGIPSGELERVFERFYQVDGGSARRFGGMGIGLALCREIVEMHGGRIWAESEGAGKGSAFHIALPLEGSAAS